MTNLADVSTGPAENLAVKLLTICVAAYNGEATLSKALNSCMLSDTTQLEVIVVDDGSTDQTARVAEKYVNQQPDTFRLIRKPNGGYGSAVMAGLKNARGKYFRTLDCDDWLDTKALEALLEYLKTCSTDIVFTNYCTVQGNQVQRVFRVCNDFQARTPYTFTALGRDELDMEIHGMNCRTQMLRASGMNLMSHCNYTDMAYTFISLSAAQTVSFLPVQLYNYRLGRDGQSVSIKSYEKHFDDYIRVTRQILQIADQLTDSPKADILRKRARDIAQNGIELLLRFPESGEALTCLVTCDRRMRRFHPVIAHKMHNKNIRLLRLSRYSKWIYGLASWNAKRKKR